MFSSFYQFGISPTPAELANYDVPASSPVVFGAPGGPAGHAVLAVLTTPLPSAAPPAGSQSVATIFHASEARMMSAVRGGYTATERVGLSIQPRTLQIRFTLNPFTRTAGAAAPDGEVGTDNAFMRTRFRVVLFRDREYSASIPTAWPVWTDIFAGTAGTSTSATTCSSFMRLDNAGRFQILSDRSYKVDNDDPAGHGALTIPLRGSDFRYSGPGFQDVRSGHVFMIVACETHITIPYTAAAEPALPAYPYPPQVTYTSRLSYTDA